MRPDRLIDVQSEPGFSNPAPAERPFLVEACRSCRISDYGRCRASLPTSGAETRLHTSPDLCLAAGRADPGRLRTPHCWWPLLAACRQRQVVYCRWRDRMGKLRLVSSLHKRACLLGIVGRMFVLDDACQAQQSVITEIKKTGANPGFIAASAAFTWTPQSTGRPSPPAPPAAACLRPARSRGTSAG